MSDDIGPRRGLDEAIRIAGGKTALARLLGRSKSVIGNWRRRGGGVPPSALPDVVRVTGLTVHELRPDLFAPPHPPQVDPTVADSVQHANDQAVLRGDGCVVSPVRHRSEVAA